MAAYFTMPNLYRDALLAAVITLLSVGRIVQGGLLLHMTLVQASRLYPFGFLIWNLGNWEGNGFPEFPEVQIHRAAGQRSYKYSLVLPLGTSLHFLRKSRHG